MSKKSCIFIPDELFDEFLQLTNNDRNLSKVLWSFAQNSTVQEQFGLDKGFTAVEFLDKLGQKIDLGQILDTQTMLNYIEGIEGLDQIVFETIDDAFDESNELQDMYPNAIPLIQHEQDGFSIRMANNSDDNARQRFVQQQMRTLNGKLIDYIGRLGFAVQEVEGLETPGLFSPLNAAENADGLKMAIQISKGRRGQLALPEEISHLLVEGFQENIFMKRLMAQMDDDVVRDILGDEYNRYNNDYKGDEELLKKEAVGRLVAQHLVDRNGIGDEIRFISDKMLDKMRDNLKKGNEDDIDAFLREMDENVKNFVGQTLDMDEIEMFDEEAVNNSTVQLKHIDDEIKSLKKIVDESYNIMAKRVKIKQIQDKTGKQSKYDILEFKQLHSQVEQGEYTSATVQFLQYVQSDCQQVLEQLKELKQDNKNGYVHGLPQLKRMFRAINQANTIVQAYRRNISEYSALSQNDDIVDELDPSYIEDIQRIAQEISAVLDSVDKIQKEMNFNGLTMLYKNYWGGDKEQVINGKKTVIRLEDILEQNAGDMDQFSRLINSLSDSQDPLLQMVDMLMKDAIQKRDTKIFQVQQELGVLMDNYVRETGSRNLDFAFEHDENGKVTGMLRSDRDYNKYHKQKNEHIQDLKQRGFEGVELTSKIKKWENDHTELVNVAPEGMPRRMERMPKLELYKIDKYAGMDDAQRKLYDKLIEIKKAMDYLLPAGRTHLYRAPMKKIEIKDQAIQGRNIKGALKRIKDKYIKDVGNDVEYGEDEQIDQIVNGQHVILDFSGKEVKKVPVYYTTWLDDMSTLDTNLIDTLLAYSAMAINYNSMSEIADFMEATNSLMQDRKIKMTQSQRFLRERFKPVKDIVVEGDYIIEGRYSESAKKLRNYIDANVYGRRKERKTIRIGNKEFVLGKIGDNFKNYTSLVGLGYNIFSGTTNLTMGMAQTLFEAAGNSLAGNGLFRLKDIVKANKMYFKDLPRTVAEQYLDNKNNKLSLLIQKFDCMEEYYSELNDSNYYGGIFKKIIGKHNPLILNSMGEHYLHTVSMLAALNNVKVKVAKTDADGKVVKDENGNIVYGDTMSLYDAMEIKQNNIQGIDQSKTYSSIDIPRDSEGNSLLYQVGKDENGSETLSQFGDDQMFNLKMNIQHVNHGMHGAFNEVDRGDINRFVLGRMVMQFRQWMPAFYMKRFRGERFNVITGQTEEGFYRTYYRFMLGMIKDIFTLKRGIATRYNMLSETQKSNVWKGLIESMSAILLMVLLSGRLGEPDKDDPAALNILKYNMYRLKMELMAATPISLEFYNNAKTLIKSPIPAMENMDRLLALLKFWEIGDTIESGKYAGWDKYLRSLYFAVPYVKNVGKFVDMIIDGDVSMFAPYTSRD